jgi:hypothetical protein
MLPDIFDRVTERLNALQLSASRASEMAGLSPDAIRNLKRAASSGGRRGVSTHTLAKLATVLETSVEYLLTGQGGIHDDLHSNPMIPIEGYVGAGSDAHFYSHDNGPVDYVAPPENINGIKAAVEIRGDSLGAFFAGWLVFYSQKLDAPFEQGLGRLCVVGLADGRVLIKKIARGNLHGRFNLYSQFEPPIYDADILWAAKVEAMAPR